MMKVYPEAYSNELKRLLPDSDAPLPDPDNEYYTLRTKEGRLLAAGVVWKSRLHPRRFRFYIGVEELYRRRGYGTMIFERMRADHPDEKWQGSVDLDNDVAEWWLRGLDSGSFLGINAPGIFRNGFRLVVFSVVIMVVVLFFRKGIMGDREIPEIISGWIKRLKSKKKTKGVASDE